MRTVGRRECIFDTLEECQQPLVVRVFLAWPLVSRGVVPVRRWVPDSVSWARLEEAGQAPLAQLLGTPPPLPALHSSIAVTPNVTTRDSTVKDGDHEAPRSNTQDPGGTAASKDGDAGAAADTGDDTGNTGDNRDNKLPTAVGEGGGREPLYLHDWSLPQNLGTESPLLQGRFQVGVRLRIQ